MIRGFSQERPKRGGNAPFVLRQHEPSRGGVLAIIGITPPTVPRRRDPKILTSLPGLGAASVASTRAQQLFLGSPPLSSLFVLPSHFSWPRFSRMETYWLSDPNRVLESSRIKYAAAVKLGLHTHDEMAGAPRGGSRLDSLGNHRISFLHTLALRNPGCTGASAA
jgi:hypothetical protein